MQSRPHHRSHGRCASLSARGQFLNTFAGPGLFLALALLSSGLYLVDQQIADPLGSSDAGLIFAAVLMSTSLALLAALLHQRRTPNARTRGSQTALPSRSTMEPRSRARPDLPRLTEGCAFRYVDRAHVRLRQ